MGHDMAGAHRNGVERAVGARGTTPLAGQVAVVTGASSGLGLGVSRARAHEGTAVAIDCRSHEDDARRLYAEIESAVCWLVSDDADYVVGTTLFVDGGMTLCPGFRDNG